MKRILTIFAGLFMLPLAAFAAPVTSAQLMGLGMPAQLASKVASIGNGASSTEWGVDGTTELTLTDDTLTFSGAAASIVGGATSLTLTSAGSVIAKAANDPQRLLTYAGSSDTALTLKFGDGGTTASQVLTISAGTSDADDDGTLLLSGGGAASPSQGGHIGLYGNQRASVGGQVRISAGDGDAANYIYLLTENASSKVFIADATDGAIWEFQNGGDLVGSATLGGNIQFQRSGKTIAIDSGTAASACKGTGTYNGTSAVTISTTCAATNMLVLMTPTATSGGTASHCWFTNIVNGTSFDVDCDAANTATFAWMIVKEG